MKISLYSVHDALNGFGSPTLQNNDSAAMRGFAEIFKDVYSPQDYSLYKLGEFDTDSGEIESIIPMIVCRATDFVKGEDKDA